MVNMEATYMTHSGDDSLIANAARVSFAKETMLVDIESATTSIPARTDENAHKVDAFIEYLQKEYASFSEEALAYPDHRLVNFLADEKHLLPFRHPHITLRCKVPLFLARQLGKHQVGMTWSEESRRYIDSEPEFWWPDKWRKRAEDKKQGSSDEASEYMHDEKYGGGNWATIDEYVRDEIVGIALSMYKAMIEKRVAPEQARMILPQNMMVNYVWTGSLLSWFHLYDQRTGHGAQREATEFADMVKEQIAPLYPAAWAALETHARNFKMEE